MSLAIICAFKSSLRSQQPCLTNGARQFHSTVSRAEQFLKADQKTFDKIVLNSTAKDKVVLVDFYADWCSPCRMLSPILQKVAEDTSIKTGSGASLDLVTIDTDVQVELGRKYEIRSLPTVMAFREGEVIDQFVGALNEAGVRHFLKKI